MKKILVFFSALLLLAVNTYADDISLSLNGESIEFPTAQPFIMGNRVFIPLRGVFEKLGYEISWDSDTKTALLVSSNKTIEVSANKNHVTIDKSTAVALDLPVQIVDGTMMIPLRAVGTAAGIDMEWDHTNKTVMLRYSPDVYISNDTVMYGRAYEFLFKCLSITDYTDMLYLSKLKDIYSQKDVDGIKAEFDTIYGELNDYRDIIYDFIPTDKNEEGLKEITLRYIDNEKKFIDVYRSEIINNVTPERYAEMYAQLELEYNELETLFEDAVSSYHYRIEKFVSDNFSSDDLDGEKRVTLDNYITRVAEAGFNNLPVVTRLDIDVFDLMEKPDEYAKKLKDSESKRNAAFSAIEIPEGFEKRAEILYYANSMLGKMAEALEAYSSGSISYKRAETMIFIYGELYDDFNDEGAEGRMVRILKENTEVVTA